MVQKQEVIYFRIHKDDKAKFQKYAEEKGRSMSELLTDYVKEILREWEKTK